ncbi:hypothetical protein Tco_1133799 [Tanacetum coccineum]
MEEEKSVENNRATDKSMAKPSKSDEQKPPKEDNKPNEGRRRADDDPAKGARENVIKNKEEEPAGVSPKVMIKFDKGTITLKSRKSKISFHMIPEPYCRIEKGIKNDIEPITPMMTINSNECHASVKEECKLADEEGVTLYLMRRSLEVLREFLDDDSWMTI